MADDGESRLQSPPQPIDPADVDLNAAETIVAALVGSIGDDGRMHAIFPRLVMASGAPDPDNDGAQYMALMEDPHLPTKVWRWLLAVALRANEEDRYGIAARAALWGLRMARHRCPIHQRELILHVRVRSGAKRHASRTIRARQSGCRQSAR